MSKNLSEQICEICGIKPRYKDKHTPCSYYVGVIHHCNFKNDVCNSLDCDNYIPDEEHLDCKDEKCYYPDFENNNNNFVKLFNLKCPYYDTEYGKTSFQIAFYVFFNYVTSSEEYNVEGFLKGLIKVLKRKTDDDGCREQIKKAIKKENWEI